MSEHESKLLPSGDGSQGELLPGARFLAQVEMRAAELEQSGEFSGERLWRQRPDTYKAIVVLLGQRMGVIRIGQMLGVSPNTVLAVRDREQPAVDMVKEHLARVAHAGATLASEGILEALNTILQRKHSLGVKDLKELAVVYGILVQNGQLLAGQPTARVEVSEIRPPGHEDWNAYIRDLPAATITHLAGEKSGAKEGGNAAGKANADAHGGASGAEPTSDAQSDGEQQKS